MRNFKLSLVVGVLGSVLMCSSAWAGPATDYVKSKTDEITKLLAAKPTKKRDEQLRKVFNETVDMRELASRSLGKHWEARTAEEQQEFLSLLQELLQVNYESKVSGKSYSSKEYTIEYSDERVREDRAIVKSKVTYKKDTRPVDYRLVKKDSWVIYDLVIDDISLEETYREAYVEIIESDGWEELIKLMKEKVEESKKK